MKDFLTIKGTLHLRVCSNGKETERSTEHNTVVTGGCNSAVRALAGNDGSFINRVAVGTNGTAATENDREITQPVKVTVTKVEFPAERTVRFHFTFGYTEAVGMSIREFGLLTADGTLFSRKVRQPIEKTADMTITGMWDITI